MCSLPATEDFSCCPQGPVVNLPFIDELLPESVMCCVYVSSVWRRLMASSVSSVAVISNGTLMEARRDVWSHVKQTVKRRRNLQLPAAGRHCVLFLVDTD